MKVGTVWAVYFSPTGTTEKTVLEIADSAAEVLCAERQNYDFTLPEARKEALSFSPEDLVILGTPVYAGRVPNVLLKYMESIRGNGAPAVAVVLYGNRNYDDALIELRDILRRDGFRPLGAGAFVGEHSFSKILAKGRPDEKDMSIIKTFGFMVAEKLRDSALEDLHLIDVKGEPRPYRGYYQPRDRDGNPIDIRKVRPLTGDNCTNCKLCADSCPMGSINRNNCREFTGICIKCGACSKKCPVEARYFEDENYLYHKKELEEVYTRRAEPELFL